MAKRVISVARLLNLRVRLLVRTRSEEVARELRHAGAEAVPEERSSLTGLLGLAFGTTGVEVSSVERRLENPFDAVEEPRTLALPEAELNSEKCTHQDQAHEVSPHTLGCEECLKLGDTWVHLRICLSCGHVGCCDSSKNKHATKHFHASEHPIIKSFEPGETWSYCYVDKAPL